MKRKLFAAGRTTVQLTMVAVFTAFLAKPSSLYNFTSFDGPGQNGGGTTVNGIDNNGDLVGFSSDNAATPTLLTNFIRNSHGITTVLNINNDPLAMANGINNALTVVGASNNQAFSQMGAVFTVLPPANATSAAQVAFGTNDHGLAVGQFTDGATDTQPGFLYNGSKYKILIPVANAIVVNAQSINDQGLVAGFYSTDGVHQHGFYYNSTTGVFTLPTDPTVANLVLTQVLGINDSGDAVGYYQTNDGSQHGFIYDINTKTYTFLDDPNASHSGFSITQITGINDSGEIDGFYVDSATGLQRGFFATPAATATPEPSSLLLLPGGLLGLAMIRRSHRS